MSTFSELTKPVLLEWHLYVISTVIGVAIVCLAVYMFGRLKGAAHLNDQASIAVNLACDKYLVPTKEHQDEASCMVTYETLSCIIRHPFLVEAIIEKESGGDITAYNPTEGAAGPAQIRHIYLQDANRIIGYEKWRDKDRYNLHHARAMICCVTGHYIRTYKIRDTAYNRARIHNGGPRGWQKSATKAYAMDVLKIMHRMRDQEKAAMEKPCL